MPVHTQSKSDKTGLLLMNISLGGVSRAQKAVFAKHLAVMLKSGLTIVEALTISLSSSQGKMKRVIRSITKSVKSGRPLSDSMERYPKVFSGFFINAARAGEQSGTLEQNLNNIAEQLEKEKELVTKVKGALLYPTVVLVASLAMGMSMTFLVLPKITPLFEGLNIELPLTTRGLIWFAHFVQDHGVSLFAWIAVIVFLLVYLGRKKFAQPFTHYFALRIPIIKDIVYKSNLVTFSRTLGLLLKSGLNIDEALEITKETLGNYYYRRSLNKVSERIGKGFSLSDNLRDYYQLYPIIVIEMVKVGEESGELQDTLMYLASFYEVEVETATKSLSTAIEPILLIIIGLVVGFVALSIITPIYNITGNIRR